MANNVRAGKLPNSAAAVQRRRLNAGDRGDPPPVQLDFDPSVPNVPATTDFEDFPNMAKAATVKIKLVSSADTGFFYVTKKNPRNITEKMSFRKYDPVARKHLEFKEAKIK